MHGSSPVIAPVPRIFASGYQPCVEALLPDLGRRYVISVRPPHGALLVPPFVMVEFRVAFLDESERLGTHPAELLILDRAHPPLFAVCSVCLEEMLCCDPCPWAVRLFSSVWPRGPTYDVGIDTPLHPLRNGIATHPLLFDRLWQRSEFCRNEWISTPRLLLITRSLLPFFDGFIIAPFLCLFVVPWPNCQRLVEMQPLIAAQVDRDDESIA